MLSWKLFDGLAGRYDSWYERNPVIYRNELEAVRSLGLRGRGLEVGVGTGRFAAPLGVPVGLDPSLNMLLEAKRRGVEPILGVAEALPVRSGSLDYVLLVVTLCFVDDPARVLKEIARVLRRNGYAVTCVIPRDSRWGQHYLSSPSPFYRVARFYTLAELEEMLKEQGLVAAEKSSVLFFGPEEKPREEKPVKDLGGGFVCLKSYRLA